MRELNINVFGGMWCVTSTNRLEYNGGLDHITLGLIRVRVMVTVDLAEVCIL